MCKNFTYEQLLIDMLSITQKGKIPIKIKMSQEQFDVLSKELEWCTSFEEKSNEFYGLPIIIDNTIEKYEVVYND